MKLQNVIVMSVFTSVFSSSIFAQQAFQNLNFEQASPSRSPGLVPTSAALPGWTVDYGGTQQAEVNYEIYSTGAPQVTLVNSTDTAFPPLDGSYSVLLQANPLESVSISQMGLIPAGTASLTFQAQPYSGSLQLTVGGNNVPITAIGGGVNETLYGANISVWSGDTEQLTFTALSISTPNNWTLDDITFSTASVPEPNPTLLIPLGGLLFAVHRKFSR